MEERVYEAIFTMRHHIVEARRLLKQMGDESEAAIEPPEQTALCNELMKIPGVIASGVPGGLFVLLSLSPFPFLLLSPSSALLFLSNRRHLSLLDEELFSFSSSIHV